MFTELIVHECKNTFFSSQKILRNPDFSTKFSDYIITCETFIKKCIKTCWMMNMQEVPMCLKFAYQTGDPFKKELYKEYTKCGGQCGYLVWPLLLLHVDGPVLQKGVMQPLWSMIDVLLTFRQAAHICIHHTFPAIL